MKIDWTYDALNRLVEETRDTGGNVIYRYDPQNRMAGISLDNDGNSTDAGETTYTYDHAGVRVRQATAGGDTTVYVNDTQNPTGYTKAIEEKVAPQAAPTRSFVIGLGVEAVAQGPAGAVEVAYQVHDGHGSTRLLLASDGDVLEAYDYTAFGDPLLIDDTGAIIAEGDAAAAASRTPWLFAGDGLYDAASGWTYHLARYRDGHRFVSFDSFEADPSQPAGLHKYACVQSNPVSGTDPTGYITVTQVAVTLSLITLFFLLQTGAYMRGPVSTRNEPPPIPENLPQANGAVDAARDGNEAWSTDINCLLWAFNAHNPKYHGHGRPQPYQGRVAMEYVDDVQFFQQAMDDYFSQPGSTVQGYRTSLSASVPVGYHKIAIYSRLYVGGIKDFHLITQDDDGQWSEKSGYFPVGATTPDAEEGDLLLCKSALVGYYAINTPPRSASAR